MTVITDLLRELFENDQRRRQEIVKIAGTSRRDDAVEKAPFYVFEGEVEERTRVALFLIRHNALKERDDFYYAALLIINAGRLDNFITAYGLIKKYRELGGTGSWGFKDKYFLIQDWGLSREQVEALIEKEIGVHPSALDVVPE